MSDLTNLRAKARRAEQRDETTDGALAAITTVTTPAGRPVWFPDTAILTDADVAAVLDVSVKTVRKWPIRKAYPSPTLPRYLFRDVVAFLEKLAA